MKKKEIDRFISHRGDMETLEEGDDNGPLVTVVDGDWDKDGKPRTLSAEVFYE